MRAFFTILLFSLFFSGCASLRSPFVNREKEDEKISTQIRSVAVANEIAGYRRGFYAGSSQNFYESRSTPYADTQPYSYGSRHAYTPLPSAEPISPVGADREYDAYRARLRDIQQSSGAPQRWWHYGRYPDVLPEQYGEAPRYAPQPQPQPQPYMPNLQSASGAYPQSMPLPQPMPYAPAAGNFAQPYVSAMPVVCVPSQPIFTPQPTMFAPQPMPMPRPQPIVLPQAAYPQPITPQYPQLPQYVPSQVAPQPYNNPSQESYAPSQPAASQYSTWQSLPTVPQQIPTGQEPPRVSAEPPSAEMTPRDGATIDSDSYYLPILP